MRRVPLLGHQGGKNSQRKGRKPRLKSQEDRVPAVCPKRKDQSQCGRVKSLSCASALSVCGCMQVPSAKPIAAKRGRKQECWGKYDGRRHHRSC